MKFLNFFSAFVALALVGCANNADVKPQETVWTLYIENNGTRMEISFKREGNFVKLKEMNTTMPFVGSADFRILRGENYIVANLGDMYGLAHGKNNIIINLDTNLKINPTSKEQMATIQNAKSFKFYEIGTGIVESIVYSGQTQVCKEFLANKPILARSVTNYYLKNGGFFASIIDAKFVYQKGAKIENKSFYYEIADENALKDAKEFTSNEDSNELFYNDIKKQGRLLSVLCSI
ncbi:MAG: hypothetical protein LUC34_01710 [Campylobacter sp.]|nr:hypothetical protein [Campylobacter sp.]